MVPKHDIPVPPRHVKTDLHTDWFTVQVGSEPVIINEAGEGSITAYTLDGTTRNSRVVAAADAVLWEGIVGLTHYEDGQVTISHRFAGIEKRLPLGVWLDEPVPTLERTERAELNGTGGTVEFTCIDCGEHIKRERHQMDIAGLTPQRCTQCTFDQMGRA